MGLVDYKIPPENVNNYPRSHIQEALQESKFNVMSSDGVSIHKTESPTIIASTYTLNCQK